MGIFMRYLKLTWFFLLLEYEHNSNIEGRNLNGEKGITTLFTQEV